jgi:hypothetical protein
MASTNGALAFGGTKFGSAHRIRIGKRLVNGASQLARLSAAPAFGFPWRRGFTVESPDGFGTTTQTRAQRGSAQPVPGKSLFGALQPGKLRIECGEGFGRSFLWRRALLKKCACTRRDGLGLGRHKGAAGALVAPIGFAATRSEKAHLQRSFIKEDVRVVRHSFFRTTTFALVRNPSNSVMAFWRRYLRCQAEAGKERRDRQEFWPTGCRSEGRIRYAGTGDLEIRIQTATDLEHAQRLLLRSYQGA